MLENAEHHGRVRLALKLRLDEHLLDDGFVDGVKVGGIFERSELLDAEGIEVCGLGQGLLPSDGVEDAFFMQVAGEELAGH